MIKGSARTTDSDGTVDYTYDSKGRLDKVVEGVSVIDRDYDSLNRLIKFTDAAGNVVEYSYDGVGNVLTLKYPGNKTVTYTYDSGDRLDFVTDWDNRVTDFQYDEKSRLSTIVFPNGTRRRLTYDVGGRPASIRDENSALQVISQYELGYDLLNRVAFEVATPSEESLENISTAVMTYDDDDRLATWNGQACASDPDGNLTTGPLNGSLRNFVFDVRNRLKSVAGTSYEYDAENRRVSQTHNGSATTYVHDQQGLLSRLLVRASGGSLTYYVYAGGMLLYEVVAGATKTYHYDFRGSTVAITDDAQQVVDRILYGPYGEIIAKQGAVDTPFLFHGAIGVETDQNRLCYMRARYYGNEMRRFVNADPIGFAAGANWYAFLSGDPINLVDPTGWEATIILIDPMKSPSDRVIYDNAKKYLNGPQEISVASHANPKIIVDEKGHKVLMSDLADRIRRLPGYSADKTITLLGCHAGATRREGNLFVPAVVTTDPVGQQLSRELPNIVKGGSDYIWWKPSPYNPDISLPQPAPAIPYRAPLQEDTTRSGRWNYFKDGKPLQ
jgi:RHS repeat-associated protein